MHNNRQFQAQVRIRIRNRAIVQANLSDYPASLILHTSATSVRVDVDDVIEQHQTLLIEPKHGM